MSIAAESSYSLLQGFITRVWGEENFSPAIVSSTGFVLATKSVAGALSYVGSPNVRTICELTPTDIHDGVKARRQFRETCIASFAIAASNISEFSLYLLIGAVSFVLYQNKSFLNLAARSIIHCVANTFYGTLGFVGQFSPTLAAKIYVLSLEVLFKAQPNIVQICKDEFVKDSPTLAEGVRIAMGKIESATPAIQEVLGRLVEVGSGIEAELLVAAGEVRAS